jgi:hypothetical protein
MTAVTEAPVGTVWEYTQCVEQLLAATRKRTGIPVDQNWYRGHGRGDSFVLRPTLYRHPAHSELKDLLALETDLMDAFMSHHLLHSFRAGNEPAERMHTLFYMQHYGVPTRLLDWTNNPMIALYFALSDARLDKGTHSYPEPAAVWVLDPGTWNIKALDGLKPPHGALNSADKNLDSYTPKSPWSDAQIKGMYSEPVAITGGANTQRMLAQRGVFTMFGADTRRMDVIYDEKGFPEGCLSKIVIQADKIGAMLDTLHAMGYTDSVAYPDLHGLALELKRLNGFDV